MSVTWIFHGCTRAARTRRSLRCGCPCIFQVRRPYAGPWICWDGMQSLFDTHKDQIEHAMTAADIQRIVNAGKIAAFLTVEGGHTIADDLRVLRLYYQLGITVDDSDAFAQQQLGGFRDRRAGPQRADR